MHRTLTQERLTAPVPFTERGSPCRGRGRTVRRSPRLPSCRSPRLPTSPSPRPRCCLSWDFGEATMGGRAATVDGASRWRCRSRQAVWACKRVPPQFCSGRSVWRRAWRWLPSCSHASRWCSPPSSALRCSSVATSSCPRVPRPTSRTEPHLRRTASQPSAINRPLEEVFAVVSDPESARSGHRGRRVHEDLAGSYRRWHNVARPQQVSRSSQRAKWR